MALKLLGRQLILLVTLLALTFSTAVAQEFATFDITPSAVGGTVTFGLEDPFSVTSGVFYTYTGDVGLFGSLNLITAVPLARTVADWLSAYVGTSLDTVVSRDSSLGVSAYTGVLFDVAGDVDFYMQTGPAATLLPNPSIDFGGSASAGAVIYF